MQTLKTRPPTCVVPWPLILVEGGEKSGKSWMFAELSASPRVGRCVWLDAGEGSADEYGDAITGEITYEVIEHNGSWAEIIGQVQAAHTEAKQARAAGKPPVCLGIDSMTLLWEMLKDWAGARAAQSESNKRRLKADPTAEIKIPNHIWNDVHARWRKLMRLLMTFEGIAVVTARGKETIKIDKATGEPVPKQFDYKVEAQRNLQFDATVWVRLSRDAHPQIVGARSKHLRIRYGKDEARVVEGMTLEHLVFEGLRCSMASQPRDLVQLGRERLPEEIRDEALATTDRDDLLGLLAEASHPQFAGVAVENENGDEELLVDLITRHGIEVTGGKKPAAQQGRPASARPPLNPDNRFYREKQARAAQDVPAAPDSAGGPADEPAPAELLDRLGAALTACGSTSAPAQLAVAAALVGRKLRRPEDLTRAEAVKVGRAAQAALATAKTESKAPRDVLSAMVGQALKQRQAAPAAQPATPGKAA
ncbi:hypothetical protein AB0F17_28865 [Nonomuraea sp. NPDC026600]|uniref:hypothetical protein n=1 Tax=Nonomuraea sp. NPDC026600 TaxID=3155363 RepID=UPI0033E2A419